MERWPRLVTMTYCGLFVCMVGSLATVSPPDSCDTIRTILTAKFQKHTRPMESQNLQFCPTSENGYSCCNAVSEFTFSRNIKQKLNDLALYNLKNRLMNFNDGMFLARVDWEIFNSKILEVEAGLNISYEHFFELALERVLSLKPSCANRREIRDLKRLAMPDIINLVNYMYAYQKGVQSINATLIATSKIQLSDRCAHLASKAGVPLDKLYTPTGCPVCLDSTARAGVCRDYCLNVVRGCYATVLQYRDLFLKLVRSMDTVYYDLYYNLEVESGSLPLFFKKVNALAKKKTFTDDCVGRQFIGRRSVRRERRQGPTTGAAGGPDLSHFKEFFSRQMGLSTFIADPATKPCAHSNNTGPCWNGGGVGHYQSLAYAYTIEEQRINPEGADLIVSKEQAAAIDLMNRALLLINRTIGAERLFPVYRWQLEGGTATPPIDMGRTEEGGGGAQGPHTTSNRSRDGAYTVAREGGEVRATEVPGEGGGGGGEDNEVESNAREVVGNSALRDSSGVAVTICLAITFMIT